MLGPFNICWTNFPSARTHILIFMCGCEGFACEMCIAYVLLWAAAGMNIIFAAFLYSRICLVVAMYPVQVIRVIWNSVFGIGVNLSETRLVFSLIINKLLFEARQNSLRYTLRRVKRCRLTHKIIRTYIILQRMAVKIGVFNLHSLSILFIANAESYQEYFEFSRKIQSSI